MVGFDPNSVFKKNDGVVDQSDLTTFVNLSVSIPRRIINTLPSPSTIETSYNSIMLGSDKGGMSTSYVDITFSNSDDGIRNRELFGITDINIEFDTSYHPIVRISFTDIKGSALFNPSSTASLNKENISENVFFGSLFHFPYPTFKLTVKGYYGDKVTFGLRVYNFDAEFDSNTGNYNVKVEFIGDKYGVLSDIPMSLLYIIPMKAKKNNNVYEEVEKDTWKTCEIWKTGGEIKTIPTFFNIKKIYEKLTDNSNVQGGSEALIGRIKKYEDIRNQNASIKALNNSFTKLKKLYEELKEKIGERKDDTHFIFNDDNARIACAKINDLYIIKEDEYRYDNTIIKDFFDEVESSRKNFYSLNDELKGKLTAVKDFLDKCLKMDLPSYYKDYKGWDTNYGKFFTGKGLVINKSKKLDINLDPSYDFSGNAEDFYKFLKSTKRFQGEKYKEHKVSEVTAGNRPKVSYVCDGIILDFSLEETYEDYHFYTLKGEASSFFDIEEKNQMHLPEFGWNVRVGFDESYAWFNALTWDVRIGFTCRYYEIIYDTSKSPFDGRDEVDGGANNYANAVKTLQNFFLTALEKRYNFIKRCENVNFYEIPQNADFESIIFSEIKLDNKSEEEVMNDMMNEFMNYYNTTLGFVPTIPKICEILFAHIDYLGEIYMKNMYSDIISGNERTGNIIPTDLIVDYNDDIVTKEVISDGIKTKKRFVPPFPLLGVEEDGVIRKIYPNKKKDDGTWNMKEREYIDEISNTMIQAMQEVVAANPVSNHIIKYVLPSDLLLSGNPYESSGMDNKPQHIVSTLMKRSVNDLYYGRYSNFSNFLDSDAENIISVLYKYNGIKGLLDGVDDYANTDNINLFKKYLNSNNIILDYSLVIDTKETNLDKKILKNDKNNIYLLSESYVEDVKKNGVYADGFFDKFEQSSTNNPTMKPVDGNYTIDMSKNANIDMEKDHRYMAGLLLLTSNNFYEEKDGDVLEPYLKEINNSICIENPKIDKNQNTGETRSLYKTSVYWILKIGALLYFDKKLTKCNLFKGKGLDSSNIPDQVKKMFISFFKKWVESSKEKVKLNFHTSKTVVEVASLHKYCGTISYDLDKKVINFKVNTEDVNANHNPIHTTKVYLLNISYSRNIENYDNITYTYNGGNDKLRKEIKNIRDRNKGRSVLENQKELIKEVKNNLYYAIKNIGDKYMYNIAKDNLFNKMNENSICGKNNILVVDSFMNDISDDAWVDLKTLYDLIIESISNTPSMSALQFLSKLAEKNKYLFMTLPTRHVLNSDESWEDVFSPKPWGSFENDNILDTKFVFIKHNEDSFISGGDFISDGLRTETIDAKNSFLVPFGDQKNNMFKSISMNMQDSTSTEESIANLLNISKIVTKSGNTNNTCSAMNLFDIYKSRSYKVSFEMMGNANITPLMFFYLKNVPMYSGKYRIIKVSHRITPNDFTTSVIGVKMGKYLQPENTKTSSLYSLIQILAGKDVGGGDGEINYGNGSLKINECSDDYILDIKNKAKRKEQFFKCYDGKFKKNTTINYTSLKKIESKWGNTPYICVRQNNPGNISKTLPTSVGVDSTCIKIGRGVNFMCFENFKYGFFHMLALVYRYINGDEKEFTIPNQVKEIVYKWCPVAKGNMGNKPEQVKNYIVNALTIFQDKDANSPVDLTNKEEMRKLARYKVYSEGFTVKFDEPVLSDDYTYKKDDTTKSKTLNNAFDIAWDAYEKYGMEGSIGKINEKESDIRKIIDAK